MNNFENIAIIEKMQHISLGKFIHNKRVQRVPQISLNKFSFENDIEPAVLSRIENDKQDIKWSIIQKIAKGFKIKPSELITEYEKVSQIY